MGVTDMLAEKLSAANMKGKIAIAQVQTWRAFVDYLIAGDVDSAAIKLRRPKERQEVIQHIVETCARRSLDAWVEIAVPGLPPVAIISASRKAGIDIDAVDPDNRSTNNPVDPLRIVRVLAEDAKRIQAMTVDVFRDMCHSANIEYSGEVLLEDADELLELFDLDDHNVSYYDIGAEIVSTMKAAAELQTRIDRLNTAVIENRI